MAVVKFPITDTQTILWGDVRESLREIPDASVHVIVTSPPYWGLRDYDTSRDGSMAVEWEVGEPCPYGMERTVGEYVEHTREIARELWRVLRDDGTLWLNLGDSYASGKGTMHNPGGGKTSLGQERKAAGAHPLDRGNKSELTQQGLKPTDLVGVPWRVAFALQSDGWYLRSDAIWAKRNPMPESVNGWRWEQCRVKTAPRPQPTAGTYGAEFNNGMSRQAGYREEGGLSATWADCPGCLKCIPNGGLVLRKGSWRPTRGHEYVFLLSKTADYYCDLEAVREPLTESSIARISQSTFDTQTGGPKDYRVTGQNASRSMRQGVENLAKSVAEGKGGRNLRTGLGLLTDDYWEFPTQSYSGAHFATFPERIPEIAIRAGSPQIGVCAECGAPWVRVISVRYDNPGNRTTNEGRSLENRDSSPGFSVRLDLVSDTSGWRPSCSHASPPVPATVLDSFNGSGTTLSVASRLGRRGLGIELNFDYIALATQRIMRVKQ